MSEHEEQEGVFKVTDRRLFNSDGSVRDGVVIEKPAEKAPEKPAERPVPENSAAAASAAAPEFSPETVKNETVETDEVGAFDAGIGDDSELEEMLDDGEEIPGEQDPASFVNFMMSLASQAAAALGAMPHPATGQRTLDLDLAKHWIDTLAMLKEKTAGNLHPKEDQLMTGLLSDLRMQFIQLSQAAEERLKQQAAQKFSSKDVLGGR